MYTATEAYDHLHASAVYGSPSYIPKPKQANPKP